MALQRAVDDGILGRNVAALVGRSNRPKVRHVEMNTIAAGDEPHRFLEAAKGERLEALLVLALTTGMRRGELLALRWDAVDLDAPFRQPQSRRQRDVDARVARWP